MTFRELLSQPFKVIYRHGVVVWMMVVIILAATVYPSDMENDYAVSKGGHQRPVKPRSPTAIGYGYIALPVSSCFCWWCQR